MVSSLNIVSIVSIFVRVFRSVLLLISFHSGAPSQSVSFSMYLTSQKLFVSSVRFCVVGSVFVCTVLFRITKFNSLSRILHGINETNECSHGVCMCVCVRLCEWTHECVVYIAERGISVFFFLSSLLAWFVAVLCYTCSGICGMMLRKREIKNLPGHICICVYLISYACPCFDRRYVLVNVRASGKHFIWIWCVAFMARALIRYWNFYVETVLKHQM